MVRDWDIPKWRREGRTGPGSSAPKYASRKDRNTVRRGGSPGKGSGGSSTSMSIIAIALLAVPALAIFAVAGFLLHGHGVI